MARKKEDRNSLHLQSGNFSGTGVGLLGILGVLVGFALYLVSNLGNLFRLGGVAGSLLLR